MNDDALEVLAAHDGAGAHSAEVTVGVDINAGHGLANFTGGSDAKDGPVPGVSRKHLADEFPAGKRIHAAHEACVLTLDRVGTDAQAAKSPGPAGNNNSIEPGKAHGECGPSAAVTLAVLVVIG